MVSLVPEIFLLPPPPPPPPPQAETASAETQRRQPIAANRRPRKVSLLGSDSNLAGILVLSWGRRQRTEPKLHPALTSGPQARGCELRLEVRPAGLDPHHRGQHRDSS